MNLNLNMVEKKNFLTVIILQVIFLIITITFLIKLAVFSSEVDTHIWLHRLKNFNLSVHSEYQLKYLELSQRKEIVCFVVTTPSSRFARSAIRRTWGKKLKPLFVMQNAADDTAIKFLKNEANVFSDMIVIDDANELSVDEKSFVTLKFFRNFFNSSQHFMIIGDDVMINTENLFEMLNENDEPKIIIPPPTKFIYKAQPRIVSGMHKLLSIYLKIS
mgnify:CR=1 FL=1